MIANPIITLDKIMNAYYSNYIQSEISKYNSKFNLYNLILHLLTRPEYPTVAYIPYLADFIFDKIDFRIDGVSIDELKDNYMYIFHHLLNNKQQQISYNKITHNNEQLLLQSNKKDALTLFIEIPFYFSQNSGLAFPLISSQLSKLEIIFKIKNLDDIIIKNEYVDINFKNKINMTMIYSVIYLDDTERELFSTKRLEYLYERKIFNNPIQLDITKTIQNKYHLPLGSPIKDYFYFVQLNRMIEAKQYYNYTFNYMLPELNMSTRNKLIYLYETIMNGYYDNKIYDLYQKFIDLSNSKIIQTRSIMLNNILNTDELRYKYLYNNLNGSEQIIIENEFNSYYESILKNNIIDKSILYLNSVERYKMYGDATNKIIPYQFYNNMIAGLQIYNFSLYPLEYQPSGNANFYVLKPEIEFDLDDISSLKSNDILNSYVIARSYNIMRMISGIAGKAWN